MYFKKKIGNEGEDTAVKYLKSNGYKIIDRNFHARHGEIDIVAKQDKEWVFIEVKTRTSDGFRRPIDAVNEPKQKHLIRTVKFYLYCKHLEDEFVRIDIIEVYLYNKRCRINHIKQAF